MNDIFHYVGNDLQLTNTGSLLPIDGTVKGQQRVLRRLLTNPGEYIWHTNYGAGLAQKVGSLATASEIQALIQSQMLLEAAVAQDPPPAVKVQKLTNGVSVQINYVDAQSKTAQVLTFDVNR